MSFSGGCDTVQARGVSVISNPSPQPRRRWLRFSLRTLLILVTVICVWMGIEKSRVLKQDRVATEVRELGGNVFLGYRFDPSGKPKEFSKRSVPAWVTSVIDEKYFLTVVTVNFDNDFGNRPSERSKAHGSQATDEGLVLLKDVPNVTELLLAGNNQLTDGCLRHAAGLRRLRVITLNQTSVVGPGLAFIRASQNLEGLALNDTPLTDEGMVYLSDLPKLEWLFLGDTAITDKGLPYLVSLKSLRNLALGGTNVTDKGLKYLAELKGLTRLSLQRTAVTKDGCAELQRSLPTCKILAP
jgi:hypothetical protein